jgi:hypothetical protein
MTKSRSATVRRKTFQQRLRACERGGNLTVADLARWFDRPYPTVRSWMTDGIEPGGGPIDKEHAESMLALLETLIKQKRGFPVPRMSPHARIAHLEYVRDAFLNEAAC